MVIKIYIQCRTQTRPIKMKHLSPSYWSLNVKSSLCKSPSVNLTLSYLNVIHITDTNLLSYVLMLIPCHYGMALPLHARGEGIQIWRVAENGAGC
jgi:hypothetical protein